MPEYVGLIKPTLLTARSQALKAFTSYFPLHRFLQQLYRLALQWGATSTAAVHRICQQTSLNWS